MSTEKYVLSFFFNFKSIEKIDVRDKLYFHLLFQRRAQQKEKRKIPGYK